MNVPLEMALLSGTEPGAARCVAWMGWRNTNEHTICRPARDATGRGAGRSPGSIRRGQLERLRLPASSLCGRRTSRPVSSPCSARSCSCKRSCGTAGRLEALEDAVSVIAGNQMAARALAHCHDWQPECEPLWRSANRAAGIRSGGSAGMPSGSQVKSVRHFIQTTTAARYKPAGGHP
jgi:hypothetical protein